MKKEKVPRMKFAKEFLRPIAAGTKFATTRTEFKGMGHFKIALPCGQRTDGKSEKKIMTFWGKYAKQKRRRRLNMQKGVII